MTIQTAYQRNLTQSSAVGTFRYFCTAPASAVLANGAYVRAKIKAHANGPFSASHMWLGHKGSGALDFDGGQSQLKFNGNNGLSIAAGAEIWSDPVAVNIDSTKPLAWAYDVLHVSGNHYALQGSLSGHKIHYKAGHAGAGNGDTSGRSGYTEWNDATAVITEIQVADTLEAFDTPGGEGVTTISTLRDIELIGLGNGLAATSKRYAGVSGQRLVANLSNNSDAGGPLFLDKFEVEIEADGKFDVYIMSGGPVAGSTPMPMCNTNFKAPYATGPKGTAVVGHSSGAVHTLGGQHAFHPVEGRKRTSFVVPVGFHAILHPGETGVNIVVDAPGAPVFIHLEWHHRFPEAG